MKPTHKFNSGNKATLCKSCRCIITEGFTNELLCVGCQEKSLKLLKKINIILTLDSSNITDSELIDNIFELDVNEFIKHLDDEES